VKDGPDKPESGSDALVIVTISLLPHEDVGTHCYNLCRYCQINCNIVELTLPFDYNQFLPRRALLTYHTYNTNVDLTLLGEKYPFVKSGVLKLGAWYLGRKADAEKYEHQEAEATVALGSPLSWSDVELRTALLIADLNTLQYLVYTHIILSSTC
jgi:hypothetical protein